MRRKWRLQANSRTLIVLPTVDLFPPELSNASVPVTNQHLDSWLTDSLTKQNLLQIYEHLNGRAPSFQQLSDQGFLEHNLKGRIIEAFKQHELVAVEVPRSFLTQIVTETTQKEEQRPNKQSNVSKSKQLTWVAISLVDLKGKPVPHEKFKIELPDGTIREDQLDAQGRARIDDIEPGECEVCFTDIDGREWDVLGGVERNQVAAEGGNGASNTGGLKLQGKRLKEGEQISALAEQQGFRNWHHIWNHPKNAQLRQLRANHHTLHPDDLVFLPNKEAKKETADTGRVNAFEVDLAQLFIRIRLEDVNARPLAQTDCTIGLDKKPEAIVTDAKGIIEHEIGKQTKNGELVAAPKLKPLLKFDLKIGSLRDQNTFAGQQERLNNLGYFAGFTTKDQEQFRWAVEEFLCDTDKQRVKTTPIIDEEKGVVKKSGEPDTTFIAKLVKEHGI